MNLSGYEHFQKKKDGIPKFPLYGYDNAEAIDEDVLYIKANYPLAVRKLQQEVEEECDKLEYDGSCMFDKIPDPREFGAIVDKIYETMSTDESGLQALETESISPSPCFGPFCPPPPGPCRPGQPCPPPPPPPRPGPCRPGQHCPPPPPPRPRPCGPGGNCRPPGPDYRPDGQPDWMRNLISVLLSNEMVDRRRRYRNRKQWF